MEAVEFLVNVITVLILYGPAYLANTGAMLFGKWIPDATGIPKIPIDRGHNWYDGNRILGDGKSWNGLLGGSFVSALLMLTSHTLWDGRSFDNSKPFVDPLELTNESDWFWVFNDSLTAFILGFLLGLACLIGDSLGSFIKRRKGLKREGDISSKAPILDTMPFAISIFLFGFILFPGQILTQDVLVMPIIILLTFTPVIHRMTNILGYRMGLKDVPY
jgi:CDP-2,3-bis-(O-geranylgeranyl)-sn-glycerol synthase